MIERLHHSLTERGFQIAAPKELVDAATSQWGAMLDEARSAPTLRVLERQYQDEGVVLAFDVTKPGTGPSTGPMEDRAGRMVDIMVQMNDVAAKEGLADPHFMVSRKEADLFGNQLVVSVERRDENEDIIATMARRSMVKYGQLMDYYNPYRDDASAEAFYDINGKVTLLTGSGKKLEKGSRLVSSGREPQKGRFLEFSTQEEGFNKREVLITVLGALSLTSLDW